MGLQLAPHESTIGSSAETYQGPDTDAIAQFMLAAGVVPEAIVGETAAAFTRSDNASGTHLDAFYAMACSLSDNGRETSLMHGPSPEAVERMIDRQPAGAIGGWRDMLHSRARSSVGHDPLSALDVHEKLHDPTGTWLVFLLAQRLGFAAQNLPVLPGSGIRYKSPSAVVIHNSPEIQSQAQVSQIHLLRCAVGRLASAGSPISMLAVRHRPVELTPSTIEGTVL